VSLPQEEIRFGDVRHIIRISADAPYCEFLTNKMRITQEGESSKTQYISKKKRAWCHHTFSSKIPESSTASKGDTDVYTDKISRNIRVSVRDVNGVLCLFDDSSDKPLFVLCQSNKPTITEIKLYAFSNTKPHTPEQYDEIQSLMQERKEVVNVVDEIVMRETIDSDVPMNDELDDSLMDMLSDFLGHGEGVIDLESDSIDDNITYLDSIADTATNIRINEKIDKPEFLTSKMKKTRKPSTVRHPLPKYEDRPLYCFTVSIPTSLDLNCYDFYPDDVNTSYRNFLDHFNTRETEEQNRDADIAIRAVNRSILYFGK